MLKYLYLSNSHPEDHKPLKNFKLIVSNETAKTKLFLSLYLSLSLLYVAHMKSWKYFNQSHSILQNNMQENSNA
jgi:hypothetical protein